MRVPVMDGASLEKNQEARPETYVSCLPVMPILRSVGLGLQSGQLFKILNKPCSPEKLGNAIQAAFNQINEKPAEEEAPPPNVI